VPAGVQVAGSADKVVDRLATAGPPDGTERNQSVPLPLGLSSAIQ
jgi:hypothetical protein